MPGADGAGDAPGPTLAERLDHLFRTVRDSARGTEYSYEQVAAAIAARGGPTISSNYIYMLRRGIRDNPTKRHLEALADFFDVGPEYFFESRGAREGEPPIVDEDVWSLAERASELPKGSRDLIDRLTDHLRALQGGGDPGAQTAAPPTRQPERGEPSIVLSEIWKRLELLGIEPAPALRTQIEFADLALENGQAETARVEYERALEQDHPLALLDEVRLRLGDCYGLLDDHAKVKEIAGDLVTRALAGETHLHALGPALNLTFCHLDCGEFEEALRVGHAALSASDQQGWPRTDGYFRLAATTLAAYLHSGDLAHGIDWANELTAAARKANSIEGEIALCWNTAYLEEAAGRLDRAVHLIERAAAQAQEANASLDNVRVRVEACWFVLRAHPKRAPEVAARLDLCRPPLEQFDVTAAEWEHVRAICFLLQGRPEDARVLIESALRRNPDSAAIERIRYHMCHGDALAATDRRPEALAAYRDACRALTSRRPSRITRQLWRELAERFRRIGAPDDLLTAASRAFDSLDAGVFEPLLDAALPTSAPPPDADGSKLPTVADACQASAAHAPSAPDSATESVPMSESARAAREAIEYSELVTYNGGAADAARVLSEVLQNHHLSEAIRDEVRWHYARALEKLGRIGEAVNIVSELFDRAVRGECAISQAELGHSLCWLSIVSGDYPKAVAVGEFSFNRLAEAPETDPPGYFRIGATLVWAYGCLGDFGKARTLGEELIEVGHKHNQPDGAACVMWNLALLLEAEGDRQEALQQAEHALSVLSERAAHRDVPRLRVETAWLMLRADPARAAEALALLDQAWPAVQAGGDRDICEWSAVRAQAHLHLDQLDEGLAHAERAIAGFSAKPGLDLARVRLVQCDLLAALRRADEAAEALREAGRTLQQTHPSRITATIWREIAERHARAGRAEEALAASMNALDAGNVPPGPTTPPPTRVPSTPSPRLGH